MPCQMQNEVTKFIRQFIPQSDDEAEFINQNELVKEFPKGTILLHAGDVGQECFFVLKGCIRSYYLVDGEEKTTAFFVENEIATPVS